MGRVFRLEDIPDWTGECLRVEINYNDRKGRNWTRMFYTIEKKETKATGYEGRQAILAFRSIGDKGYEDPELILLDQINRFSLIKLKDKHTIYIKKFSL